MLIKQLKVGEEVIDWIDSNSQEVPKDLSEFKTLAVDTLMWKVSQVVKKASGGNILDVVTTISKIQVAHNHLLLKLLKDGQIKEEPKTIQDTISKMEELYSKDYADSQKALTTIISVDAERDKLYQKIPRVMNAKKHDEVIAILNED